MRRIAIREVLTEGVHDSAPRAKNWTPHLVDVMRCEGCYELFLAALEACDLDERLKQDGPFTVFAPMDRAFRRTADLREMVRHGGDLRSVLTRHVVRGRMSTDALLACREVSPLFGASLPVGLAGRLPAVGGARIEQPDIFAGNGVLHGIDRIVLGAEAAVHAVGA
ncbi:MAG: fasciclin domain-containing protein [Planctomycetota bacterium]|nr:fasciclin domain-containing protein [Planctomycetota bacterium]